MTDAPVTQADRVAAIDHGIKVGRIPEMYRPAIEAGEWDHTDDVQSFAAHRLATIDAAIAALRTTDILKTALLHNIAQAPDEAPRGWHRRIYIAALEAMKEEQ